MSNLTLLIPAKFEFESLPIFLKELEKYDYKKKIILELNDTKTIEAAKQFTDVEILYQTKSGYGNALIEGINHTNTKKTENSCFTYLFVFFVSFRIFQITFSW